jgi:hypothetical protein
VNEAAAADVPPTGTTPGETTVVAARADREPLIDGAAAVTTDAARQAVIKAAIPLRIFMAAHLESSETTELRPGRLSP